MLILASSSPRRQELLRNAGIAFTVMPAHIPEERRAGESAEDYVLRLSVEKAAAVAAKHLGRDPLAVLGADTVVLVEGELLEKPRDAEEAKRMLGLIAGRSHEVITGICISVRDAADPAWSSFTSLARTRVVFDEMTASEIDAYVATGEPLDKAGAYAIQGIASRWIAEIEGCYFNVVGLPVPLVYRMLREHAPDTVRTG
jgi:nucleoside triphosphate pyrophosphatase